MISQEAAACGVGKGMMLELRDGVEECLEDSQNFGAGGALGVIAESKAVMNKCPCAHIFSQLRDYFLRVNSAALGSHPPALRCWCCI